MNAKAFLRYLGATALGIASAYLASDKAKAAIDAQIEKISQAVRTAYGKMKAKFQKPAWGRCHWQFAPGGSLPPGNGGIFFESDRNIAHIETCEEVRRYGKIKGIEEDFHHSWPCR